MARSLGSLLIVVGLSVALVGCSGDGEEGTPEPIVPTASLTLTASPEPTETAAPTGEAAPDGPRRTGASDHYRPNEPTAEPGIETPAPLGQPPPPTTTNTQ